MNQTRQLIARLTREYNPEHDISDASIQMNWVDGDLLTICAQQQAVIEALQERLHKLEVFTGMVAPHD